MKTNPSPSKNPWPTLTGDEIARRIRMAREYRARRLVRMAAFLTRRRQLIAEARSHLNDVKTLLSASDDEL